MQDKVKLIWNFYGPDSKQTADHHLSHLNTFLLNENISYFSTGVECVNENYCSYVVMSKEKIDFIRKKLNPNKGILI